MLLLPLTGVFLLFTHKGLIKFFSVLNRSIFPAVFYGITFSSLFQMVHALFQYDFVKWYGLLLPAIVVAAVMAGVIYKKGINPTAGGKKQQIALIILISFAYGFGSTRVLNCAFDHSEKTAYEAIVQKRFISSGRGRDFYYLELSPWGPKHSSAQVEVGRLLYRVLKVGDTVTVKLKQGLLRAPWYWVEEREDNLIQGKTRD